MNFGLFKSWTIKILLAYLLLGVFYYLSGSLFNFMEGRQIIFSPVIGLPLTIIGWPQMLRADFIHRELLGLRPHSILTSLLTIIVIIYLFRETVQLIKSKV